MFLCLKKDLTREVLEMFENSNEIEAGVVTEDSKKFDGDGLEMKYLEETTDREVHSAIDQVGGKDEDVSKSFRSQSDKEVATLMREVYLMSRLRLQEFLEELDSESKQSSICSSRIRNRLRVRRSKAASRLPQGSHDQRFSIVRKTNPNPNPCQEFEKRSEGD
ncbi:hypothetical protein GIB67_015460 [Kingdonia uniflora]|uniref:Uncharacterized protein n=1 Tax=Kingdonia uniflora TaxID=39325 RepID=A0A7J7KZ51_9MAGN|nr:hypothetical protein GIB67_015460 [Kingdonia uniflora]